MDAKIRLGEIGRLELEAEAMRLQTAIRTILYIANNRADYGSSTLDKIEQAAREAIERNE